MTRLHTRILTYKCTLTDCVHPLRQVDYETVTVDEGLTPGNCVPNVPRGIWLWSKMYQKRGIKLETVNLKRPHHFAPDHKIFSSGFWGKTSQLFTNSHRLAKFTQFLLQNVTIVWKPISLHFKVIWVMQAALNFLSVGLPWWLMGLGKIVHWNSRQLLLLCIRIGTQAVLSSLF